MKIRILFLAALVSLFFVIPSAAAVNNGPVVPVKVTHPNAGKSPTLVSTRIYVIDIDDINGAEQNFTANFAVRLTWNDPRLAIETNITRVVKATDIWNPNVIVMNKQRLWESMPDILEIDQQGNVSQFQRYVGLLSQPLNLAEFPYDSHTFKISLIAIGNFHNEVQFIPYKLYPHGMADVLSVADWKITPIGLRTGTWEAVPGIKTSVADYSFVAKRLVGYYVWKVILPLVLIVMMSFTVFWIDPTFTGSQIGVATTSMLTLIAYRFLLGDLLPNVSYLTRLDKFIISNTVLVFLALVEVIITSSLANQNKEVLARKFDVWSRFLFPIAFVILLIWSLYL
jgi:hypothetical protein